MISTIEAGLHHVIAALQAMESCKADTIEVTPAAADAFDAELRAALAKTVWHSGCTNWYVDEQGNDPSQWPWSWSEYRRRTERLDPNAYDLA